MLALSVHSKSVMKPNYFLAWCLVTSKTCWSCPTASWSDASSKPSASACQHRGVNVVKRFLRRWRWAEISECCPGNSYWMGKGSVQLTFLYQLVQISCFWCWERFFFSFRKTCYLNEEVNSTEPSPLMRVLWFVPMKFFQAILICVGKDRSLLFV
jgi:hypothetical protein